MMSQAASIIMRSERLAKAEGDHWKRSGCHGTAGRAQPPTKAPGHNGQPLLAHSVAVCGLERGAPSGETNSKLQPSPRSSQGSVLMKEPKVLDGSYFSPYGQL